MCAMASRHFPRNVPVATASDAWRAPFEPRARTGAGYVWGPLPYTLRTIVEHDTGTLNDPPGRYTQIIIHTHHRPEPREFQLLAAAIAKDTDIPEEKVLALLMSYPERPFVSIRQPRYRPTSPVGIILTAFATTFLIASLAAVLPILPLSESVSNVLRSLIALVAAF